MSRENAGLLLEKFGYGIAAAVHIIGLHIDYADLTREVDRLVAEIDPKAHD